MQAGQNRDHTWRAHRRLDVLLRYLNRIWFALAQALAVGAVLSLWVSTGRAADHYPSRPITIIVPFSAGAVTDVLARIVAKELGARLGQPFVIENKPGAGTLLAAETTARASPDGYTLLVATSSTMSINSTLYKHLPYNPAKDFVPVSLLCSIPFVLVANPKLPITNAAGLIKLAKEKPGQLNYGTGGIGTTASVLISLLKSMTGAKMTEVVYRGIPPALTDMLGGTIQFMFSDIGTVAPLIRAGKVRALGVSTAGRFKGDPEIPTLAESGVPGFAGDSWQMLVAPANTPTVIVDRLNVMTNQILNSPEVVNQLLDLGMSSIGRQTPNELEHYVESESARWGKVVTDAGFAGSQ
jgi:tripartite-type tricarboxylate transporter receptor subunit TctC